MSITAIERIDEALDSLCESNGMPDVREVRARELKDSSYYQNQWFEDGYRFSTIESRIRDRYKKIYQNSFSEQRNGFDEFRRVLLRAPKKKN